MLRAVGLVNSKNDVSMLKKHYSDIACVRIGVYSTPFKYWKMHKIKNKLWVDPCTDVYHNWPPRNASDVSAFSHLDPQQQLSNLQPRRKPDRDYLKAYVQTVMQSCYQVNPDWISVPQLPYTKGKSRHKANVVLAEETAAWKIQASFRGKLILPIIFADSKLARSVTFLKEKLDFAMESFNASQPDGVWVVDASLDDHSGSPLLSSKILPRLFDFHTELLANLPSKVSLLAGPYWLTNIILWARGLVDIPVIGMGRGYRYGIRGGFSSTPKTRVVMDCLKRQLVLDNINIADWIESVIERPNLSHDVVSELRHLRGNLTSYLKIPEKAPAQSAAVYRTWIESISEIEEDGRALALYQELSKAFANGKAMKTQLPQNNPPKRPEKVVQELMLSCL